VVAQNAGGAVTSALARVTVVAPAPNALLHWWPGDGTALDFAATNHGVRVNGSAYAPGLARQAFDLDGVDDYIDVGELTALTNATEFTVMAWINKRDHSNTVAGFVGRFDSYPLCKTNNSFLLYTGEGASSNRSAIILAFTDGTGGLIGGNTLLPAGQWVHVAATWRSADGLTVIYRNGVLDGAGILGAGKTLKYIPGLTAKIGEWGVVRTKPFKFSGQIDEVTLFKRALSAAEIQAVVGAGSGSMAKEPVILAQPVDQFGLVGGTASLSVTAIGLAPVSYQWRFEGLDLPGATNSMLLLINLALAQSGLYSVQVSNALGVAVSQQSALFVQTYQPLAILQSPANQTPALGLNITLSVDYTGSGPVAFQWRLNGVNLPGATNSTLTLYNVQLTNSGIYYAAVSSETNAINSAPAQVKVQGPALAFRDAFESQVTVTGVSGAGRSGNVGATVQAGEPLHAGKTGGHSMWLDWLAPTNGIAWFTTRGSSLDTLLAVYAGATVSNLVEITSDDDSGGFYSGAVQFNASAGTHYRIAVDGLAGANNDFVVTWSLEVTNDTLPIILAQPASVTTNEGASAMFTLGASGGVTYQWYFNGQAIPSATNSGLALSALGVTNVGTYWVRVTKGNRVVQSRAASLQLTGSEGTGQTARAYDKFGDASTTADALELGPAPPPAPPEFAAELSPLPMPSPGVSRGYSGTQIFSAYAGATELSEPNHCGVAGGSSQWITYRAGTNGTMFLNTDGSTFDTVLAVYTGPGTSFGTLQLVACDNNSGLDGRDSALRFVVTRGVTYYLVVDGVRGATGTVRLNFSLVNAARLTPLGRSGGTYRGRISCLPGMKFSVQRSDDLRVWTTLLTTNAASGIYDFTDASAGAALYRFYRTVSLP
jgi:hypothetical protein